MSRRRALSTPGDAPRLTLVSGDVYGQAGQRVPATIVIEGETIVEVAVGSHITDGTARQYEVPGGLISPGLLDLHVHGGGGWSVFEGPDQLRRAGAWLAQRGVTGFLASIPSLPWPEMVAACSMLAKACAAGDPPNLLGIHVEGPHLSPRRAGSQPVANLRAPALADYKAMRAAAGRSIKVMTIAPELPGALEIIESCRRDGVLAALGHSDATYDQALAGFAAGVSHVTHLYNAMRPFHHRVPGAVAAALACPGITVELILDGEHISRGAWDLARAAVGLERICLVSDALPAAGSAPGAVACTWAGQELTRRGRRLELAGGTLAGSDIALHEAVVRAHAWGATRPEAIAAASAVPARALGLGRQTGSLLPGYRGDLIVTDGRGEVLLTLIAGVPWPPPTRGVGGLPT